jgi:hypothetical protein
MIALSVPGVLLADADGARRAAAAILREGRFHSPLVPRPLHGLLTDLGDGLSSVGRAVARVVDRVGRLVPGGAVTVWIVLGLLVLAAAAILARRSSRRDAERDRGGPAGVGAGALERAADLEREAARAEDDGRFADAVRLRFRAGLARLSEDGVIGTVRSTPTAQLARTLRSADFDELARRFDEIVYGAEAAEAQDAEEARRRWPAVLSGDGAR